MALQNVRSLLWRGEDLGFGGGNTREVITPTQVVAASRPTIITRAFTGSLDLTSLCAVTPLYSTVGRNRIIVNRNPRYWITLGIAFQANGTPPVCMIPVAPLQAFFLPQTTVSVVVTPNSAWPVPQPLSGASSAPLPIAQSTNVLTVDIVLEN